ncbi:dienelactone hydrolase [Lewinellaceae bacterium SD302]|nr:dienelactone hydrolase [Lewinellaceae bacterium SD302]
MEEAPVEKKAYKATAFAEATPTVDGQEIEYATDDTKMIGYLASDPEVKGKRPGVLVIHEWWGHNDYARARADMLAELGYVALAVDMYGDGKQANHPADAGKFSSAVVENMDAAKARFEQAIKTLKANPLVDGDKIAAVGYCFGGSIALAMANAGYDLDAVAAFHAGVQLPVMPSTDTKVTANILVANGAADPFISPESVAQWSKAMDEAKVAYEYKAFEGVKHAFTDPGATEKGQEFELPLEYSEKADRESWVMLQELLAESFR